MSWWIEARTAGREGSIDVSMPETFQDQLRKDRASAIRNLQDAIDAAWRGDIAAAASAADRAAVDLWNASAVKIEADVSESLAEADAVIATLEAGLCRPPVLRLVE